MAYNAAVKAAGIFSYDGTNRIRFTGQGDKALSQPDASGPPKIDLLCSSVGIIIEKEKYVKERKQFFIKHLTKNPLVNIIQ